MTGPAPKRLRISRLATLGRQLGSPHDQTLADIADAIDFAVQVRHDTKCARVGRPSQPPGQERPIAISYENPTGALAQHWRIPAAALARLGYPEAATDPNVVMSDVFTVRLGAVTVWGNAETGVCLRLGEPGTVYR